MSTKRTIHGAEDAEIAYKLQVMGAREGAIKGTLISGALVSFANWRFPLVARQTLAGKAFLTSWGTIAGMVIYADHYLLSWEREHKAASERWRSVARNELAATGTVPSESVMQKWKRDKDAEYAATLQSMAATPGALPVDVTSDAGVKSELAGDIRIDRAEGGL